MANSRVAVLVVSWDGMSFIWDTFFYFFFKNWKDCEIPIYLGSNFNTFEDQRIIPVMIGTECGYSANLRKMLEQIKEEHVLLIMDDFILSEKVNNEIINKAYSIFLHEKAIYFNLVVQKNEITKLYPKYSADSRFSIIPYGFPYRVTLGAGFWDRKKLLSLLPEDFSAWEIERVGSINNSISHDLCLCISSLGFNAPPLKTINAIQEGKWTREFIGFISSQNINKEFLEKKPESDLLYTLVLKLYEFLRFNLIRTLYVILGEKFMYRLARIISEKHKSFQN